MKNMIFRRKKSDLDSQLDWAYEQLRTTAPRSEKGQFYLSYVERLEKLKRGSSTSISADTKAMIFANLAGLVLILNYEKAGVITSKALGFVTRGRI